MRHLMDKAEDNAGAWAEITRRGHRVQCRYVSRVTRNGISRMYLWRVDGKPAKREVAMRYL